MLDFWFKNPICDKSQSIIRLLSQSCLNHIKRLAMVAALQHLISAIIRLPEMEKNKEKKSARGCNPNSLRNLRSFKPGQSGNPGGNFKRTPRISNVYARLLAMSLEDFEAFKPSNAAEEIAYQQIKNATCGKPGDTLRAIKEITDRTEGRAPQRVIVDNTNELERLVVRIQARVLSELGIELTREQAIERVLAYRPELGQGLE